VSAGHKEEDAVVVASPDDTEKVLRIVLEHHGLYRPTALKFSYQLTVIVWPPSITLPCQCAVDTSPTWFLDTSGGTACPSVLNYVCLLCRKEKTSFWVRVEERREESLIAKIQTPPLLSATVIKTGQWPPQSARPSAVVRRALTGDAFDLYRKGLTTLNHGYGVAAFSYFRRIVELQIDALIDDVRKAAELHADQDTLKRIDEAVRQKNATERLRLAAEAMPAYLRPGGANPLSALYGQFSVGIHALDDGSCLAIAHNLRDAFEYVLEALTEHFKRAREFQAKVAGWKTQGSDS